MINIPAPWLAELMIGSSFQPEGGGGDSEGGYTLHIHYTVYSMHCEVHTGEQYFDTE